MNYQKISWPEVENMLVRLKTSMDKDGFVPDFVLGISRGGYVPAVLLNLIMPKWTPICYVDIARDPRDPRKRKVVDSSFPRGVTLKGKKVLVCEDKLETGLSFAAVREYLEERGAEVRTLSFFNSPRAEITPDYSYQKWIDAEPYFPWEEFREKYKRYTLN